MVSSLSSDHALRKTFELVATTGPAARDFDALFATLDADPPHSVATALAVLLFMQLLVLGEDTQASALPPELAAADRIHRAGEFVEAEAGYQALLKTDSKWVPAQVGLVRAMLRLQKIDEALDTVNTASAAQSNSAALLTAKGDVQFGRAEMSDAELSYLAAKKLDRKEVHAYLGLAQVYGAYSLYRTAYGELRIAHEFAPDDIEVQRAWLGMLPRKREAGGTGSLPGWTPSRC